LNTDTQTFNPSGSCQSGGMYFSDVDMSYLYLDYGNKISLVSIPDDAQVYVEESKFKTDKLILTEIIDLYNFYKFDNYQFCKLAIAQNGLTICNVKDPPEELCKLAVSQNSYALQYIKKPTEEVCKLAFRYIYNIQNQIAI
jgi:hypothetical protein